MSVAEPPTLGTMDSEASDHDVFGTGPKSNARKESTYRNRMTRQARPTELEELYRQQGRELWALFYAHCNDPERAYDALQESFLRLQAHRGIPIRDLRAWLLRVGRNWLRDVARRKANSVRSSDKLDDVSTRQPADPAALLSNRETRNQVRDAMGQLRDEDREVLVLRYSMNWSSNRIAETLNVSPAAIDMRLSRARKRLACLLEEAGISHEHL